MCLTLSLAAVRDKEERAIAASPKSCPSTKLSSKLSSRLLPVRSKESREEDQRTAYTKVFRTHRALITNLHQGGDLLGEQGGVGKREVVEVEGCSLQEGGVHLEG